MDIKVIFNSFAELIKKTCPDKNPVVNVDVDVKSLEIFYPEALKVIQKDESIFSVERIMFGVNISDAWKVEEDKTELYKSNRSEWLRFLKGCFSISAIFSPTLPASLPPPYISISPGWIQSSQLFHADYPKSFHEDFYPLRIRKLGIVIYDYLHEISPYYQTKKEEAFSRLYQGENVIPEEWMDGRWLPMLQHFDPAEDPPSQASIVTYFFPLTGTLLISSKISS
jgi:hypothetical protein